MLNLDFFIYILHSSTESSKLDGNLQDVDRGASGLSEICRTYATDQLLTLLDFIPTAPERKCRGSGKARLRGEPGTCDRATWSHMQVGIDQGIRDKSKSSDVGIYYVQCSRPRKVTNTMIYDATSISTCDFCLAGRKSAYIEVGTS